jgi:hypothetical protein
MLSLFLDLPRSRPFCGIQEVARLVSNIPAVSGTSLQFLPRPGYVEDYSRPVQPDETSLGADRIPYWSSFRQWYDQSLRR